MNNNLKQGVNIEKEHRNLYQELSNRLLTQGIKMPMTETEFFTWIAQAHIAENKDYYPQLLKYVEKKHDDLIEKNVHVNGIKEPGKVYFKNNEGYYVKFKDGSDGYFQANQLQVMDTQNFKTGGSPNNISLKDAQLQKERFYNMWDKERHKIKTDDYHELGISVTASLPKNWAFSENSSRKLVDYINNNLFHKVSSDVYQNLFIIATSNQSRDSFIKKYTDTKYKHDIALLPQKWQDFLEVMYLQAQLRSYRDIVESYDTMETGGTITNSNNDTMIQEQNKSALDMWKITEFSLPKYKPFETLPDDATFMAIQSKFTLSDDSETRLALFGTNFSKYGVVSTDAEKLLFSKYNSAAHAKYGNYCHTQKCFKQVEGVEEAKYPDWTQVIPSGSSIKWHLNISAIINCIKNLLKLQLLNKATKLIALTDGENTIGFNAQSLLKSIEALVQLGHTDLEMGWSAPNCGVLIYPKGSSSKIEPSVTEPKFSTDFCLVMPMMLSSADISAHQYIQHDEPCFNVETNCVKLTANDVPYCFDAAVTASKKIQAREKELATELAKSQAQIQELKNQNAKRDAELAAKEAEAEVKRQALAAAADAKRKQEIDAKRLGNIEALARKIKTKKQAKEAITRARAFTPDELAATIAGNEVVMEGMANGPAKEALHNYTEGLRVMVDSDYVYADGGDIGDYKLTLESYFADVYEDDYNEGEGEHVNYFQEEVNIPFNSPDELMKYITNKVLYKDVDKTSFDIMDDGRMVTSILVDADNSSVSELQIEKWKKGELKLYSANYNFVIELVSKKTPTADELSKLLGISTYAQGGNVHKKIKLKQTVYDKFGNPYIVKQIREDGVIFAKDKTGEFTKVAPFSPEELFTENPKFAQGGGVGTKINPGVYRVGKPIKVSPILYEQKIAEVYANGSVAEASNYARKLTILNTEHKNYPLISESDVNAYKNYFAQGYVLVDSDAIYSLAENMSDTEYDEKYSKLSAKQKDTVSSLIRLGDTPKLALATVLLSKKIDENSDTWNLHRYSKGGSVGAIKDTASDIEGIEHIADFSIRGNSNELNYQEGGVEKMIEDHRMFLNDKEFLEKYHQKIGCAMPDDDDFDDNGQMDEFRITDKYYLTFTDGSEIVLDFTVDGDLLEVYVPEDYDNEDSMAGRHAEQYRKDGWDMDIDSLEQFVNTGKFAAGGGIKSWFKNKFKKNPNNYRVAYLDGIDEKTALFKTKEDAEKYYDKIIKIEWAGSISLDERENENEWKTIKYSKGSSKFKDGGPIRQRYIFGIEYKATPTSRVFKKSSLTMQGGDTPEMNAAIEKNAEALKKQEGWHEVKITKTPLFKDGGTINGFDVDEVVKHYLIAALWSSTDSDDDDAPFDSNYGTYDFAPETVEKLKLLVNQFLINNSSDLKESGLSDEQIGHDLWLTQVGHGAGFWDRGLDKQLGDRLSAEAKKLGQSANLYANDGVVYIDGLATPTKTKLAKGGGVKGQVEYVLCKTISGEGYSDPEFKLFTTRAAADSELKKQIKSLEEEGYTATQKSEIDFSLEIEDDEDTNYYRIQLIEVPAGKAHLVNFTEPNEVSIVSYNTKAIAKKQMKNEMEEISWEDTDEYDEYDGEDSFGSHGDDGFVYFEVLSSPETKPAKKASKTKLATGGPINKVPAGVKHAAQYITKQTEGENYSFPEMAKIADGEMPNVNNALKELPEVKQKVKIAYDDVAKIRTWLEKNIPTGGIDDQYYTKTPKEVWEAWTEEQRSHFLLDHSELLDNDRAENNLGYSRTVQKDKSYNQLTEHTKGVLEHHVNRGQYEKGGGVKKEKSLYQSAMDKVDKKVYNAMLDRAKENKAWAEKTNKDKKWKDTASNISIDMLNEYLTKSVEQIAEEHYRYLYYRAHAKGSLYGSPSPIDPAAKREWEELSGKKIK